MPLIWYRACALGWSCVRNYCATDSCKRGLGAAGVVGLAAARALALTGREVLVIERADAVGTGTSSRNSEIIHAGAWGCTRLLSVRFCSNNRRVCLLWCWKLAMLSHRARPISPVSGGGVPVRRHLLSARQPESQVVHGGPRAAV
jgi:hypothetical protein